MTRVILFVVLVEVIGASGSIFTAPAIPTWYAGLKKPWFNPPNWLFGPAWTLLFALMGVALHLVTLKGWEAPGVRQAVVLFAIQMVLNVAWSGVFFGARSLAGGMLVIVPLLVLIVATIMAFLPVSRTAGLLMLPYLAWTCFATLLNYSVWRLNA